MFQFIDSNTYVNFIKIKQSAVRLLNKNIYDRISSLPMIVRIVGQGSLIILQPLILNHETLLPHSKLKTRPLTFLDDVTRSLYHSTFAKWGIG